MLSHNRIEHTKACIASIVQHVRIPFRLRIIDDASEPAVRRELASVCAQDPNAVLQQLETQHGCAAARQLGAESSDTEFVVFVDNDAEVFPGTVEHLVYALDQNPQARALGLGSTLTTRHTTYEKEVDTAMGIPPGFHSYAILPIGYPMGRFGPVGRGPLSEVVYLDGWGKSYPGI